MMIRARERRKTPRHQTVRTFARFGWWDGEEFRHVQGRLADLGSRGAAVVVDVIPENLSKNGWFTISGRSSDDWFSARVVATATGSKGNRQLRLSFDLPCPNHVFQAAVWGIPSPGVQAAPSPSESQFGDDEVVPPPRPQPRGSTRADASKSTRDEQTAATADDWALSVLGEFARAGEARSWADVRAEILARQRVRHLPLLVLLGLNALLTGLVVLIVATRFSQDGALRPLLDALR